MADAIRADRGEFLVDPTVGDKRLHWKQSCKSSRRLAGTVVAGVSGSFYASDGAPDHSETYNVSACSALLRQGRRDGWTAESYRRIAKHFDTRDPIAALTWADLARRVG